MVQLSVLQRRWSVSSSWLVDTWEPLVAAPPARALAPVQLLELVVEVLGEHVVLGREHLAQEPALHRQLSRRPLQLIAAVTFQPDRSADQLPRVNCAVAEDVWRTHARTHVHCNGKQAAAGHTHTHLTAPCPGLPGWAGTRKVKLIWILLKQETVSGSGISKSAPSSRQITTQAPHHSVSYRPDALHVTQATASKHWTQAVAAVLSAKGRTAAATYQIALAHARYSLYFTVGWEMPPNCPFTGGSRLPSNT